MIPLVVASERGLAQTTHVEEDLLDLNFVDKLLQVIQNNWLL